MNKYVKFGALAFVGYFMFSRYLVGKTSGTGNVKAVGTIPINNIAKENDLFKPLPVSELIAEKAPEQMYQ
jgi:hypothetical protein